MAGSKELVTSSRKSICSGACDVASIMAPAIFLFPSADRCRVSGLQGGCTAWSLLATAHAGPVVGTVDSRGLKHADCHHKGHWALG